MVVSGRTREEQSAGALLDHLRDAGGAQPNASQARLVEQ